MILHKIYETVEEVKCDLQQLSNDQQRRKFIESVKEDKEDSFNSNRFMQKLMPKDPLKAFMSEEPLSPSDYENYTEAEYAILTNEVIKFCITELEFLTQIAHMQPGIQQTPKPKNSFINFLVMDELKKQQFADKLKRQFPGISGKELGILLKAMETEGYICIIDRKRKILYDCLNDFFGWGIGSNESINRAIRNMDLYCKELEHYRGIVQRLYESIQH